MLSRYPSSAAAASHYRCHHVLYSSLRNIPASHLVPLPIHNARRHFHSFSILRQDSNRQNSSHHIKNRQKRSDYQLLFPDDSNVSNDNNNRRSRGNTQRRRQEHHTTTNRASTNQNANKFQFKTFSNPKYKNKVKVVPVLDKRDPRSRHEGSVSPSQIRHSFFKLCSQLASKGDYKYIQEHFLDSTDLIHPRYGSIPVKILDPFTNEQFLALYILAMVNANRVKEAEQFFLQRFKTRLSPNGYLVAVEPYIYCNLIKGFAKEGNVTKVTEWIDILSEEVPYKSDEYRSIVTGFMLMSLTRSGRVNEALEYFRGVIRDYGPDVLKKQMANEEQEQQNQEDSQGQNSSRPSKKRTNYILTAQTVTPLMQALSNQRRVREVEEVYSQAVVFGDSIATDINIHNTLLDAYVRVGDLSNVLRILGTYFVFNSTAKHSSIVDAFFKPKQYENASNASKKRRSGLLPNEYTLMNLLRFWANRGETTTVERIYEVFVKNRPYLNLTGRADSMRILALSSSGDVEAAQQLFDKRYQVPNTGSHHAVSEDADRFVIRDEHPFSNLLLGYAKKSDMQRIRQILSQMSNAGIPPRKLTINTILRGLVQNGDMENAREIFHDYCVKQARKKDRTYVHPDAFTFTLIMRGFAATGQVDKIQHLLSLMTSDQYRIKPNEECFAALLEAYFSSSDYSPQEAIEQLTEICTENIAPRNRSALYKNLLDSLATNGQVEKVDMLRKSLSPQVSDPARTEFANSLLTAHIKRGDSWSSVYTVFQETFDNPFALFNSSESSDSEVVPSPNAETYHILLRRLSQEDLSQPENQHLKASFEKEMNRIGSGSVRAGVMDEDSIASMNEELLADEYVEEV